jgi:hypothetical protein
VDGTGATTTVTLSKPFTSSKYILVVGITRGSSGSYRDQFLVGYNKQLTSFGVYSNWAGSSNATVSNYASWCAYGY